MDPNRSRYQNGCLEVLHEVPGSDPILVAGDMIKTVNFLQYPSDRKEIWEQWKEHGYHQERIFSGVLVRKGTPAPKLEVRTAAASTATVPLAWKPFQIQSSPGENAKDLRIRVEQWVTSGE